MTRIALVEDNPDNRLLISLILGDDYDVVEFEDGPAAVAGLAASGPDLVLMDISLPGMDGPDVLGHLREDPRTCHLPVVALTAHAMVGDRERYISMGFDGYVGKPIVDEMMLLDEVSGLLPGRVS
ncbi:MAG: response regulator [Myxococcota bacterium]